jgi:hypothetical protein
VRSSVGARRVILPSGTVTFCSLTSRAARAWNTAARLAMQPALARTTTDVLLRDTIVQSVRVSNSRGTLSALRSPPRRCAWSGVSAQRALRVSLGRCGGQPAGAHGAVTPVWRPSATATFWFYLEPRGRLLSRWARGQVLLSRTAYDLVRRSLPAGRAWRPVCSTAARLNVRARVPTAPFPTCPRTSSSTLAGVAAPTTCPAIDSFIGRDKDIAEIKRRSRLSRSYPDGRGRSGKTRIALLVAADVLEIYPHCVSLSNSRRSPTQPVTPVGGADAGRLRRTRA